jgi:hypothetical protein
MRQQEKRAGGYDARQDYADAIAFALPWWLRSCCRQLTGIQFQAIEAVVSATLGFGISSILG